MTRIGRVCVLGMARSGVAVAEYLADLLGTEVDEVVVYESGDSEQLREVANCLTGRGIVVRLGTDNVQGRFDLGVASPGIPPAAALFVSAEAACDKLISELEFAFVESRNPWAAVTGTNGKTTTTALLAHLLRSSGMPAVEVGNIGTPAIAAVREAKSTSILVAETSSFQLALTETFCPRVAVLLNITPDHLDWHGSMEAYAHDKAKVFQNMDAGDTAIINVDDAMAASIADSGTIGARIVRVSTRTLEPGGAGLFGDELVLDGHTPLHLVARDELKIRGDHNVSNALAAAAAARALGARAEDIAEGLRTFEPIEHRLEPVGVVRGAEWVNDSKATNVDATIKALTAFSDRPVILLLGGRAKGAGFEGLAHEVAARVKGIVAFGEASGVIATAMERSGVRVEKASGLSDAVALADSMASAGDVVLLSPACASFDEFTNYEERGRTFKRLVSALASGAAS